MHSLLSNEKDALQDIKEVSDVENKDLLLKRASNIELVLEMKWLPRDDVFT